MGSLALGPELVDHEGRRDEAQNEEAQNDAQVFDLLLAVAGPGHFPSPLHRPVGGHSAFPYE